MEVYWAVAEMHRAFAILPGKGMFEPVEVITLGKVLAGVGAAAFSPV